MLYLKAAYITLFFFFMTDGIYPCILERLPYQRHSNKTIIYQKECLLYLFYSVVIKDIACIKVKI